MQQRFNVRKVAVLGAGVMGAQIAAHLVNVRVPVILFDLPAKEGPKNGIVTKAVENLKKLKPAPLGVPEEAALIEQANYEEHLDKLQGVRPRHRGDRRAHGLEARPVHQGRAGDRAARDRRQQHLGAQHHQALGGAARGDQVALLRHPLLQPAALHGAGRADRDADHRSEDPRRARGVRDDGARQVGRARQGHAELHRQPGRHRRHAGDDEGGRDLRPDLRRRRRPDRQEARPRQLGARSAPPTSSASTRWRTSSRRCRTTSPGRSVLRELRDAGGAGRSCSMPARSARRPAPASTRRSARTSCATTPARATTSRAAARPTRSSRAC